MNYETIDSFQGDYRFLSNFWTAGFKWNGDLWRTSEHAYQASKATKAEDYYAIKACKTAGQTKRYATLMDVRPDWHDVSLGFMSEILHAKFSQNPYLITELLATGYGVLIEGNTWGDTFWGQCNGVGENHLGRILMDLRAQFRAGL